MDQRNAEDDAGCRPRTVAQGALGRVLVCEHCRQVHLQVGALTLRLTPEAFEELSEMTLSARRGLQACPDAPSAASAACH
ncbi:hypothetical protein [Azohydromonas australica]|uniref:hypothetical protein n=1 Tax=Azohydromonas australica TaxID=364039 RepID=UPI00040FC765|nr:hypothetical protein [Azohydromonas australica]